MIDFNEVFQTALELKEAQLDDAYDRADVPLVQELVIAFRVITTDRAVRLQLISDLVGRPLGSTKELRVAEVKTILALLDQSDFVTAMKENIQ